MPKRKLPKGVPTTERRTWIVLGTIGAVMLGFFVLITMR